VVYRIEWRPRARKAFLALDKPVRQRIAVVIDKLADDPGPAGVKTLTGMRHVFWIRVATPTASARWRSWAFVKGVSA
jgi:mRNA-degrading endonuclease RelE of RelBE toxin-antitoxin system